MRTGLFVALLLSAVPVAAQETLDAPTCRKTAVILDVSARRILRILSSDVADKQLSADVDLRLSALTRQRFLDQCLLPRPCHSSHWGQNDKKGYEQAWLEAEAACW